MAGDKIQYTCHPVRNLKCGPFRFVDSLLTLEDEAEEQTLLAFINHKKFPAKERHAIKKLDLAAATVISKNVQASKPKVTQTIDSSVGERVNDAPKIGLGDLLRRAAPAAVVSEGGVVDATSADVTQSTEQG
jgi:hypothetical protein